MIKEKKYQFFVVSILWTMQHLKNVIIQVGISHVMPRTNLLFTPQWEQFQFVPISKSRFQIGKGLLQDEFAQLTFCCNGVQSTLLSSITVN